MDECNKQEDIGNLAVMDDADADEEWLEWVQPFQVDAAQSQSEMNPIHESYLPVSKLGHTRTIIHFDIDCFYAQVEMLRNPELRNKPLGIQQKNIVVTSNYEARKLGVNKLMYIADAKKKCPDLVLVSGEDLTNYRHMSYQISEFIQKYTPHVERLGFDENFVDVSELVTWRQRDGKYSTEFVGHVFSSDQQNVIKSPCDCGCQLRLQIGSQIAADIREAVEKELGITCCAGIGHNKLVAKLVAATHKPNQQTSILPHRTQELMSSLSSARCIPGIGSSCSRRLQALGISTIQDLQAADAKILEREFGPAMAKLLNQLSFGVDDCPVIKFSLPQTLSDEDSFKSCKDYSDAEQRIRDLLASLLKRVVEDGRIPQTLHLTVRRVNNNYHRESRQCPVQGNVFAKFQQSCSTDAVCEQLMPIVMNLFCKLVDRTKPFHLTLINICFAKLVKPGDEQGKISSFFARGMESPEANNATKNEHFIGLQCESGRASRSQAATSGQKSQTSPKPASSNKTLKHFFSQASGVNSNPCMKITNSNAGVENGAQGQVFSINKDNPSQRHIDSTEPLHRKSKHSRSDSPADFKPEEFSDKRQATDSGQSSLLLKTFPSESKGERMEVVSNVNRLEVSSKYSTDEDTLVDASEDTEISSLEDSLQALLPNEVDAKTIVELPADIQKEVLAQYGIFIEDLPQGRQITLMSDKVTTRSGRTPQSLTLKTKRPLFSPKKVSQKRTATSSTDNASSAPKCRKSLQMEEQHTAQALKSQNSCITNNASTDSLPVSAWRSAEYIDKDCDESSLHICNDTEEPPRSLVKLAPSTSKSKATHELGLSVCANNKKHEKSPLYPEGAVNSQSALSGSDLTCSNIQKDIKNQAKSEGFQANATNQVSEYDFSSVKMPAILADCQILPEGVSQMQHSKSDNIKSLNEVSSVSTKICGKKIPCGQLPDHIDSEVFAALPSNIQGEIMAHLVMGTSSSPDGHSSKTNSAHEKTSKQKEMSKKKGQNTLLTYFKKNSG